MQQFCLHPDFDPTFLLFLIEEGLLHHYISSNYQLPVASDKVLTLPIEVHLNLIKSEVAAKSQKIIMMGPQTMQNETQDSTQDSPAGGIIQPQETPANSHSGSMQQEQEQQQQQECNNGMDFQQPYHQPQPQPYAQGGYIPMDNMYQQQQPTAGPNFMLSGMPNMANFGMPPPYIHYGQAATSQQQQQAPPPFNGPHPTTTENAFVYIAMHSVHFYEFLFRVMQQMFSQFAPNFQQQQQQARDSNTQSQSYGPTTEPVTPLNK